MAVLKVPPLSSADDLLSLVEAAGFLPFMRSGIEGFSVQEYTPEERWFVKDVEGPWEWRETLAERGVIAYGKVFDKKAGFISPAYYPDFVNWRRGGLDFADRYDAGLASRAEKRIMDLLVERGPLLSTDLRALAGHKGFETAITSLQMRCYVVALRFEHRRDAFGRPYGIGITRFAQSEAAFGEAFVCARCREAPEISKRRLSDRINALFPSADGRQVERLLR